MSNLVHASRHGTALVLLLSSSTLLAAEAADRPRPLVGPPAPQSLGSSVQPKHGTRGWQVDAFLIGAGQVADIVATEMALARPATREANPLVGTRAVRISAKLAVTAGGALVSRELRRRGKRREARWMSAAMFAVGAAAAVHNVRVASRAR